MRFSTTILLIIWITLLTRNVQAQVESNITSPVLSSEAPTLRFEQISQEEGMMQSSANTIMQDKAGFLWIATQGGLHRYNGYEFEIFTSIPFDTTSLSENWVWAAAESKSGDLWVTTQGGGLNRLDPNTGKAVHYRHDPDDSTSISSNNQFFPFEASNGDLWVSTFGTGLNRMPEGEDGVFSHYRHSPDNIGTITSDELYWMGEDSDGNIWIGSSNGLNEINPETEEVTRYLNDPEVDPTYGSPLNVLGLYFPPGNQGLIWLATGNGLLRLNSETGDYERFLIEPNDEGINPLNFIHEVRPDPSDPNVLWVAGPGTGIARFDLRIEQFTSYRHNPSDKNSIAENVVISLFADRAGTMWAGTATEGINAFNPGAVNFTHIRHSPNNPNSLAIGNVWGIYEDIKGTLWVGTNAGSATDFLTQFDGTTRKIIRHQHNPNDPNSLLPGTLRVFSEDQNGNFWVAGSGGLNLMDRKTGKVTRFLHEGTEENRPRNSIFALKPLAKDSSQLWVGSGAGLDRFDTETKEFTPIRLSSDDQRDPNVFSLWEDTEGILWMGTNRGLYKLDQKGNVSLVSRYDLRDTTQISDNGIRSLFIRNNEPDILWIATSGGGLNRLDTKTGRITHLLIKDGLPDHVIYGILEDQNHTLWISTNRGISNFDPETYQFRNYGLDEGLIDLEFNQNAYTKGAGGMLYFGSGNGVTAFEPERLNFNSIPPQVVFTDFKLFNRSVKAGSGSPLEQPISEAEKIVLDYDQNEISIDFVALHFTNSEKNQYSYQLEGFDEEWIEAGSQRTATYTNLPPGNFIFNVKAANADGVWNEKGVSIQISVLPPWYRTWGAYIFFVAVFAAGVFGVDQFQRHRLSKKEGERAALREAELRAEAENKRRSDTEELSKIGRAITSSLSVDKIIETVYENVNILMDAAIFGVGIYNKEKECLDFPATKEEGEMLPLYSNYINEDHWLSIWCFKNRKEIVISDFEKEYSHYLTSYSPPLEGKNPNSILYMPLIQNDRIVGVITTQSFKKNAYTEYHVTLLRNLANYAAIALDNASAYKKLDATLSELQSTQQQLIQSEKMASLGELTAGIAHEIQNPLNFVNNFSDVNKELAVELLEELKKGNGQEAEAIIRDIIDNEEKILHHGKRADAIVKGMLLHSRAGGAVKESTDINLLCDEYLRLSYHGIRAKDKSFNADFKTELDPKLPKVNVVPQDIGRVLLNLINNAFYAVSERAKNENEEFKPELIITTKKNGNSIEIFVKDNGDGIPEQVRDKIFQPFFTTKSSGQGTGLGLSLSYDIVTKGHNGTIELESVLGQGSKFIVKLPTT